MTRKKIIRKIEIKLLIKFLLLFILCVIFFGFKLGLALSIITIMVIDNYKLNNSKKLQLRIKVNLPQLLKDGFYHKDMVKKVNFEKDTKYPLFKFILFEKNLVWSDYDKTFKKDITLQTKLFNNKFEESKNEKTFEAEFRIGTGFYKGQVEYEKYGINIFLYKWWKGINFEEGDSKGERELISFIPWKLIEYYLYEYKEYSHNHIKKIIDIVKENGFEPWDNLSSPNDYFSFKDKYIFFDFGII